MSITDGGVVSRRGRIRATLFDYLALTKPRTIHLVVGAIPAMLLADRGVVATLPIINTLAGAILMTAGANTLNCVADADIDKLMKRTANRPLARGALSTRLALMFGLALSGAAFIWLWLTTNLLPGLLAVATIAFYVLVYTLLIKRRTSQNVVWGGVANGMPVLIGWSGITGGIGWQAVAMFAIIFFWTPPHSWALAMRRTDDCRAAGLPMLPAVASERVVAKRIVGYTCLTVLATLLLGPATGWLYGAVALLAASWFLAIAYQLYVRVRSGEPVQPVRLFQRSNNFLSAVFLALAVDSALGLPTLLGAG
ncbi:protoheme IX farnesyltransferase [Mycobacterium alsense]|uniref:Protoheme IX farnesyltransferase n=1 Tax=Mycobacterium alsense TaxID=324058 RepID=A0AA42C0J3_9MYCO|nr:heme o synthase [Mycobacterium alsense]MCV7380244.1 protoheme IX farnesyltransferase [Mycobacterium alsense]OQZ87887.1 protoheme IX farnesyltransferase [Mycobacterium alsense]